MALNTTTNITNVSGKRLTIRKKGTIYPIRVDGKVVFVLTQETLGDLSGCTCELFNGERRDVRLGPPADDSDDVSPK